MIRAFVRLAALVASAALPACAGSAPPNAARASASASTSATPASQPAKTFDAGQRFADLGTCVLGSGERIERCRIGYRTFGTLDASRSNAILFPTWFTGTTSDLVDGVVDKLVDTKRFFLVLVDALGDGVSSSPSNASTQARLAFPRFTVHDMVETQRRLAREVLGVERFHAVIGISMGGMQAFEWAVSHPSEVERVVPIAGTPQLTSQDLLLWNAELHALDDSATFAHGNYQGHPKIPTVQDIHWLHLSTAPFRVKETSREVFPKWRDEIEADTRFDWNDWHRQLEAMLVHDVVASSKSASLEDAARKVTARALVVVAEKDQMVNPTTAIAFAQAMGPRAKLVTLDSACGHLAPDCESAVLQSHVRAFLDGR